MDVIHVPVMLEEVLAALELKSSGIYIDATLGLGGHAEGILQCAQGCTLIGIDRDENAIEIARERLKGFEKVHLIKNRFSNMKDVVNSLGYEKVNGIILDAGVSTLHLKAEGRGFSFMRDEPLDMRMDQSSDLTAEKVVNSYKEKDLADIIYQYGEERYSRRIAKSIVFARRKNRITSCKELATIIEKAVGRRGRIHPATRSFQALRIKVNSELDELSKAVDSGAELLEEKGRFCVLSYHSLEDRIVKNAFRKLAKEGLFRIITKKPIVPEREEQKLNPSSRSAKLRVAEKI
ncbi:MAG TPA: 16S rRNA (cytosine(1402)-N(4))-methyltransferase RsmH [Nitrospirae bacterium]|nr:ribosomal RNA small subunit methyltransferase H [bacterium BMS3Abin09]GBE40817.1 ribosomal RNA small subunit methyltransferase H [bacterium BMS3Bbin09]HDO67620.1 16S rRNA (cytosine(1402)-N(4))-methyltransferase RsmH [Nitrospirota bacterium]HDZ84708.1 16S rRNA (cytosine(1402)-N(4))-methyltransferase RsmH [Nitrospirota bacterium]HEW81794.1 16S rRNA (cytosine(1402)-N(4))-methyltransferase RsmH [Nitrospirota bacterium]